MTMPMTESGGPSGDAMAALPAVAVPAHGTFRFTPGHDHLMLEGLNRKLAVGDHVPVTLVFARAGKVTVSVPVVDLDRILGSS
jgi:copper(I)-binding protein